MGQALLGYAVFMIELFILLTGATNVETALWTFIVVYASCVLGTVGCVWWEGQADAVTRTGGR
jgi:hypothetical protein